MAKRYWLFKSEPNCFSIEDLQNEPHQTACWDGVRNYQARNLLRDEIKKGDRVFFYHSNAKPPGIVGICEVVRSGYPDYTAQDPTSDHPDPTATPQNPIWYMVDVKLKEILPEMIPLNTLKETPGLEEMMVCQRGARLSVQPVTPEQWAIVMNLIKRKK